MIDSPAEKITSAAATILARGEAENLAPGLYIVATPIGNLADITLRALIILSQADYVFCEDTRHSRKLLSAYNISKALHAYHDHNGEFMRPVIIKYLLSGKSVALISDAGTPLIADPGFKLVREAHDLGLRVSPIPGPSSLLAALVQSGLPTDSFFFGGFLPPKAQARRQRLNDIKSIPGTIILFETAPRLQDTLGDLAELYGSRVIALVREATKQHEQIIRGQASEIWDMLEPGQRRGEMVLVIAPEPPAEWTDDGIVACLREESGCGSRKDAIYKVVEKTGASRQRVYRLAVRGDKS